jgi:flagellar biosynthesis/type III secretory pathway protein FliH
MTIALTAYSEGLEEGYKKGKEQVEERDRKITDLYGFLEIIKPLVESYPRYEDWRQRLLKGETDIWKEFGA